MPGTEPGRKVRRGGDKSEGGRPVPSPPRGRGATAARLTPDQKVGSPNLSAVSDAMPFHPSRRNLRIAASDLRAACGAVRGVTGKLHAPRRVGREAAGVLLRLLWAKHCIVCFLSSVG